MLNEWIGHDDSKISIYDKDHMKLNKIATKNKVTTCIGQYKLRTVLINEIRLKDPKHNVMMRSFD